MVSEPLQDPLGHLLSGFRYRVTHHLCPRTKPNSAGREGNNEKEYKIETKMLIDPFKSNKYKFFTLSLN
ncbi:hypothetical protein MTR_8g028900 [Medicago truncatula]|uniref:Uncharacterized protein n=1 Tax=Medicago truncatula TaxID=3880 RepID=A0A072TNS9_MEDTR|nr:hypothetical protein MTR_8g028900 [Medicago truncatula]